MFGSQVDELNNGQLHKISLSLKSNLKMLYEQESNASNASQESTNKNVKKHLRFFSIKNLRLTEIQTVK
jgi:hypothetical protein